LGLGFEVGLGDACVEGLFECAPGAGEGCAVGDFVGEHGVEFGGGGGEDAGVGLREEDGDPSAVVGQFVALVTHRGSYAHRISPPTGTPPRSSLKYSKLTAFPSAARLRPESTN
jgi:hypothetical protein